MIRRTPLKRSAPPRKKRKGQRRSSRVRDEAWLAEVRRLPCAAVSDSCGTHCLGAVEADHAGLRGLGQKCSDRETIPLCRRHHQERTDGNGYFKRWGAARMRRWLDIRIAETAATVTANLAGIGGSPGVPW